MKHTLVTNQIELSVSNHEPFVNGDVSFLQRLNKAIMAWSPLGGGSLFSGGEITDVLNNIAEKHSSDAASVAIAWLLAHPAQIVPVLGTNNLDRIANISQALAVDLDREDWYEIYTAALGIEVA
jgi:predicted oxidoreductase